MGFEICFEDELLLCCARTRVEPEIKDEILLLVQEELDWQYISQMSSKHRLTPLLYKNLKAICPEMIPLDVLGELKNYYDANVRKNLLMTGELTRILKLLKVNDINAIPYKGPILADLAYGNISLREFNDLDIFVNKNDIYEVYKLMIYLGYELDSYPQHMDLSLYFRTQSEHKFINKKTNIILEIHNKFQGHFFSFPINPEFLYKTNNLNTINFQNFQTYVLSNESLIILLCIHCARHDWSRLFWICDIAEIFKTYEINHFKLFENAEKLGVKRILLINLFLTKDLFGLKLSNETINQIKNDHNIENICTILKQMLLTQNHRSLNIFKRIIFDVKKRESFYRGLIDVFSSIFKPTYLDFKELPLPSFLYPSYYIIRPFLLLKRFIKDSK